MLSSFFIPTEIHRIWEFWVDDLGCSLVVSLRSCFGEIASGLYFIPCRLNRIGRGAGRHDDLLKINRPRNLSCLCFIAVDGKMA